jgi:chemotaxis protein methyltransferase CheR
MHQAILAGMLRVRIFGKSPVSGYLRLNGRLWEHLPSSFTASFPIHSYGVVLHALARLSAIRRQNGSTYFFRNRPELELIRRLVDKKRKGATLNIAVLGSSMGAEVYSILWAIRSGRPDLNVIMHAVDISKQVLKVSERGVYSLTSRGSMGINMFERMSEEEMQGMFDKEGGTVRIKSWLKEGIIWHQGDARDPKTIDVLEPQDIVVANRFLCHMDPPDAEECLRNIARLVSPGGYLFVSGVDLDIRAKVAHDLGWQAVPELIEDIHDGDPSLRDSWPCGYWGLEPLNKRRHDWTVRYASAFRVWVNRVFAGVWLSKLSEHVESYVDVVDLCSRTL